MTNHDVAAILKAMLTKLESVEDRIAHCGKQLELMSQTLDNVEKLKVDFSQQAKQVAQQGKRLDNVEAWLERLDGRLKRLERN